MPGRVALVSPSGPQSKKQNKKTQQWGEDLWEEAKGGWRGWKEEKRGERGEYDQNVLYTYVNC